MRRVVALLLLALPVAGLMAGAAEYVKLPGGNFRTALKYQDLKGDARIAPFALMRAPVTNAQFLAFVQAHPEWRRDRAARVLAEPRYLSHWSGAATPGPKALPQQPVVQVSWFAAQAYCEAQGARLPTWSEWEYAAAADETRRDARKGPAWRERILAWYSKPSNQALQRAGLRRPTCMACRSARPGLGMDRGFILIAVSADNPPGDADNTKFWAPVRCRWTTATTTGADAGAMLSRSSP